MGGLAGGLLESMGTALDPSAAEAGFGNGATGAGGAAESSGFGNVASGAAEGVGTAGFDWPGGEGVSGAEAGQSNGGSVAAAQTQDTAALAQDAAKQGALQRMANTFASSLKQGVENNFVVRGELPEDAAPGELGDVDYWASAGKSAGTVAKMAMSRKGMGSWEQSAPRKKMIDEFQRSQ